ncbi:uncharacterized protein [Amphiura filiformis]|uniref:uncharacterized protein n=1 Tax=Amphiura filiformis TaxID=82378 RepID=UPI003B213E0C
MTHTPVQNPLRVLLWSHPRSLSTVFTKCISYVDNIQIINEPYSTALTTGPEKKTQYQWSEGLESLMESASATENIKGHTWNDTDCSYQWVKDTLEAEYPGKKIIFCKDHISGIIDNFDKIPHGYQHTFLIRNPTKYYISLRKLLVKNFLPPGVSPEMFQMDAAIAQFRGDTSIYSEMMDFMEYLEVSGECTGNHVIIDADDLQNHPASIVRQYCDAVGMPYGDSLLEWEAGDDIVKKNWYVSQTIMQGNKLANYYEAAFSSTKFRPVEETGSIPDVLPPDVVRLSEKAEPDYRKLYEKRLVP